MHQISQFCFKFIFSNTHQYLLLGIIQIAKLFHILGDFLFYFLFVRKVDLLSVLCDKNNAIGCVANHYLQILFVISFDLRMCMYGTLAAHTTKMTLFPV